MRRLLIVATLAAALVVVPSATALKLGQTAPANSPGGVECGACDGFQSRTAAGSPSYKVPDGKWTITKWKSRNTTDAKVRARLKVFRHVGPGVWKVIGESSKRTIKPNSAPSWKTQVKVKKGDRLGLGSYGQMVTSIHSPNSDDVALGPTCHRGTGQTVGAGTGCELFVGKGSLLNMRVNARRR